jgi:hypothetical protein
MRLFLSSCERSASQIDRVTQRLWRGVEEPVLSVAEGTPAVVILPMLLGAFQPPSRHRAGPPRFFPFGREPRTKNLQGSMSGAYTLGSHTGTLYIGVPSEIGKLALQRTYDAYIAYGALLFGKPSPMTAPRGERARIPRLFRLRENSGF